MSPVQSHIIVLCMGKCNQGGAGGKERNMKQAKRIVAMVLCLLALLALPAGAVMEKGEPNITAQTTMKEVRNNPGIKNSGFYTYSQDKDCPPGQALWEMTTVEGYTNEYVAEGCAKLPVPLANATGAIGDNCIYIAGGQETMTNEQSTNHFYMLDLLHKEKGWQKMPGWEGPSLAYAVSVVQGGRFYLFSGRSYAPNEVMVEYTEGYVYEPGSRKWSKIAGNFPVMAGTAIPYEKDKIILLGGVEEILPTSPEHPGFSRKLRVISTETNSLVDSLDCPYPIPVTTNAVYMGNDVYVVSGEIQPGIRTPLILKGTF